MENPQMAKIVGQRRYEVIKIPCDFCAYQCVSLWVYPHIVAVLKLKIVGSPRDL